MLHGRGAMFFFTCTLTMIPMEGRSLIFEDQHKAGRANNAYANTNMQKAELESVLSCLVLPCPVHKYLQYVLLSPLMITPLLFGHVAHAGKQTTKQ